MTSKKVSRFGFGSARERKGTVRTKIAVAIVASAALVGCALDATASASVVSSKLQLNLQFGREVDSTKLGTTPEEEDICLLESSDICQSGKQSSSAGGFVFPKSVATSPAGNVYVADENNNRIQELDGEGHFMTMFGAGVLTGGAEGTGTLTSGSNKVGAVVTTKKTFVLGQTIAAGDGGIPTGTTITEVGANSITLSRSATASGVGVSLVVAAGAGEQPNNERQTVTITGSPTGGSFKLTYTTPNPSSSSATTEPAIAFNASASTVQQALENLPNIGAGNVAVTGPAGGPYTVEFTGPRYADTNVQEMSASSSLSGGATPAVTVATTVEGHTAPGDDVCSVASDCVAGVPGFGAPGQLSEAQDVAVDPVSKNVYVFERHYSRVEEFTENGVFVLMIGREVNETKDSTSSTPEERNICTATEVKEGAMCKSGAEGATESPEPGEFYGQLGFGNLLAVAGSSSKEVLYVADAGSRVQEFSSPSGKYQGELDLTRIVPSFPPGGHVTGVAADNAGDIFVTEEIATTANGGAPTGIYEFSVSGREVSSFDKGSSTVMGFAYDPATGRVAVIDPSLPGGGGLFDPASEEQLGSFSPAGGFPVPPRPIVKDAAFCANSELYVADPGSHDVERYVPVPVAELSTGSCVNSTASSLTFTGTVNPNGVAQTEAWFEYGSTLGFGANTPKQGFAAALSTFPLEATVADLVPNQLYHYRTAAEDARVHAPEPPVTGKTLSCATQAAPAVISSENVFPSKSLFSSALFEAKIDPENAKTLYRFQYANAARCKEKETEEGKEVDLSNCPDVVETPPLESAEFAVLTAQQNVTELQPSTTYRYRMTATNVAGTANGQQGEFTTAAAPLPTAVTGPVANLTTTSATLTGTVDPGGVEAIYDFRLGAVGVPPTEFAPASFGSAGSGVTAEENQFVITGLHPGTSYTYVVEIQNGYGTAVGAPVTFTTLGLPTVLEAQPAIALLQFTHKPFPTDKPPGRKCKRGFKLSAHGRCVKTKAHKGKAKARGKARRR